MTKKYTVLVLVLTQSLAIIAMEQGQKGDTSLKSSSEVLSRSGGLSQSQELSKKMKQVAASYYATPCCPMAKLKDLEHDWKPVLQEDYPKFP